jgi:hypothetical protein
MQYFDVLRQESDTVFSTASDMPCASLQWPLLHA